jgi:predicted glutamine amidotransferase
MAYIPTGVALPDDETLERCWQRNKDWGGFMYVHEGRIVIEKFSLMKDMIKALKDAHALYGNDSPFVFHMRLATNGAVNMENTHPFRVGQNYAFAHNGVITKYSSDKSKSDSRVFGETILRKLLYRDWILNDTVKKMMEEYIDTYNKVIILSANKEVMILNENQGTNDKGIWWSNAGFKAYEFPKRQTMYTYDEDDVGCKKCTVCQGNTWTSIPIVLHFISSGVTLALPTVCYTCRGKLVKDSGGDNVASSRCSCCKTDINYTKLYRDVFMYDTLYLEKYCGECYVVLLEESIEYYRVNNLDNFYELVDTIDRVGSIVVDSITPAKQEEAS